MAFHRKALLVAAIVLVVGSLSATIGYAVHLRSDSYRREVEKDLGEFFELPCDVGRIRPRTFSSRLFENVAIWLPDRRDKIFQCAEAVWQETDGAAHELELSDGQLFLGSDRWQREDYRQLLASGLKHDFDRLRLKRIKMERFEIGFDRGGLSIRCRDATGNIDMENVREGVADLIAYELNGQRVSQGVRIHARFTPGKDIAVSELGLSVPTVPLKTIAAGSEAFGGLKSGQFAGTVQYSARGGAAGLSAGAPQVSISGDLEDVQLREMTGALPTGPLDGRLSVKLYDARISGGMVTEARGHGQIEDLLLAPLGPLLGQKSVSGRVSLRLEAVEIVDQQIERLVVSGQVRELSVADWLKPLGHGSATGNLSIRVNNVEYEGGQIKAADVELRLTPPAGGPGTIDRELILTAAERALRFSWPSALPQEILPEKVTYTECGVRLLVRDNQMRILGTHGKNGATILTVSVFGRPFGIVQEQAGTIDLGPWMKEMGERVRGYSPERVREWLRKGP